MELPHASLFGYGTARGMAKLYGILANGGRVGDHVLLSPRTVDKLTEAVVSGVDIVLGHHISWGYGFSVALPVLVRKRIEDLS